MGLSRRAPRLSRRFDELPGLVEEKLAEHARVVLVYFDAFGWRFLERQRDHALFAGAEVERWSSCFPSTTTVHSTTIHSGLPLGEHGLYEWNVFEPRLNRLVTPLWFCFAGDERPGSSSTRVSPPTISSPTQTLYRRLLPVPSHVAMPPGSRARRRAGCSCEPATASVRRQRGRPRPAVRRSAAEERAYGTIYFGDADALMHMAGPDAPEVAALMRGDASRRSRRRRGRRDARPAHGRPRDGGDLAGADGYVNVVWPELAQHLAVGADGKPLAPAGSCRDSSCTSCRALDEVEARLGELLAGVAEVRTVEALLAEGLFGPNVARRSSRLATVVLPARRSRLLVEPGVEQRFLGAGGLSHEMEIPLDRGGGVAFLDATHSVLHSGRCRLPSGHENGPARFCLACGAGSWRARPREERKVVTVLFADLVGFTSRAEQLDPEDVARGPRAVSGSGCASELERFGGTVEKFIGDAVMALFGAPVAHEDDPERAVRAALAIRDWAREEDDLEVRIAVTTGEALVSLGARPAKGEGMARATSSTRRRGCRRRRR